MEKLKTMRDRGKTALSRMASNASMRFGKHEKHEHTTEFDAKVDEFLKFYAFVREVSFDIS